MSDFFEPLSDTQEDFRDTEEYILSRDFLEHFLDDPRIQVKKMPGRRPDTYVIRMPGEYGEDLHKLEQSLRESLRIDVVIIDNKILAQPVPGLDVTKILEAKFKQCEAARSR